jgi:outer membrane protein TolC
MRERARYLEILQRRVEEGTLSASEMVQAMTTYDSSKATARNAHYSLISILAAAVAAIASAIAVFFAAFSVWRP